jgi:hypothetical protein
MTMGIDDGENISKFYNILLFGLLGLLFGGDTWKSWENRSDLSPRNWLLK